MKRIHLILSLILIILVAATSVIYFPRTKAEASLKIAISKAEPIKSYSAYIDWIHSADSTIETVNMYAYSIDSALSLLDDCSGLLLTGGSDIFPGLYGKLADTARCGEFDLKRDSLELALIKKAIALDIPILGICRGQQMLNIALGGSLIIDIPSDYDTIIQHRIPDTYECFHTVNLETGSRLAWASNVMTGMVNSRHHQAIDNLSDQLKVSARASDGIIESVERKAVGEHGFLMGVQWHPEQMDWNNPLSQSILEYFIMEVQTFKMKPD